MAERVAGWVAEGKTGIKQSYLPRVVVEVEVKDKLSNFLFIMYNSCSGFSSNQDNEKSEVFRPPCILCLFHLPSGGRWECTRNW